MMTANVAVWFEPRWRAASPAMQEAVAALLADILAHEARAGLRTRRRRPDDLGSLSLETERLLCNVAALRLASADDVALSIATNWRAAAGGSRTRSGLLHALCSAGLLRPTLKGRVLRCGVHEPSRWQPTHALDAYLPAGIRLADLALLRGARHFVTIRSTDGDLLTPPPEAAALDAEMRTINEWVRGLPIALNQSDAEAWLVEPFAGWTRAKHEPAPPWRILTAQHVELVRAFRGSLAEGGRMYLEGFWIGRSKEWRAAHLWLAGEPIAECDYKATNLRLAYHHCGIAWPFTDADPYIAGRGGRDGWKTVTNSMVRAKSPLMNWPGTEAERRETRAQFPSGTKFRDVKAAILRHHAKLHSAGAFGRGLGGAFERIESDVAVALLLACRAGGLPALPVHDCLLVPRSGAAEAAILMQDIARQITGVELPVTVHHGESYR